MNGNTYEPLDLWCRTCHAAPGILCAWTPPGETEPRSREPHAERVIDARDATAASRRRAGRQPPASSRRR